VGSGRTTNSDNSRKIPWERGGRLVGKRKPRSKKLVKEERIGLGEGSAKIRKGTGRERGEPWFFCCREVQFSRWFFRSESK